MERKSHYTASYEDCKLAKDIAELKHGHTIGEVYSLIGPTFCAVFGDACATLDSFERYYRRNVLCLSTYT